MIKDVEINFEIYIQNVFFLSTEHSTDHIHILQITWPGPSAIPWQSHEFSTFFPVIIMRVAFAETIRKLWLDLDERFSQGNAIHVHDHPRKDLYILEVKAQK
ncbi:hypothetical protein NC653_040020 [Populus alba x Populus x berolinensis]|uniref:Uncharacterized protein n=1 Tax=Populus alba x Populus x berolinensis TaxID=444605 RepID=A0AAD6LCR0_9ROSI|nr:hypothetical protein NC653_040020 [Populus alba x Populus x berolinensis]